MEAATTASAAYVRPNRVAISMSRPALMVAAAEASTTPKPSSAQCRSRASVSRATAMPAAGHQMATVAWAGDSSTAATPAAYTPASITVATGQVTDRSAVRTIRPVPPAACLLFGHQDARRPECSIGRRSPPGFAET